MSKAADTTPSRYKNTVLLPKTDFPMKADLVQREPVRLEKWEKARLYQQIQQKHEQDPKFILHDGPPFANGDVHMGTALNKVLKDLIVKAKTMMGYKVPFVPGWDCHGLPIEFRVVKESTGLTPVEIRQRSEEYAKKYIDIQRKSFKRLGILADWENPYLTLAPQYEADIVRVFGKLVSQKMVYRSKRPVLWSFGAQTALAEAEVEYKEKVSEAIYVRFSVVEGAYQGADIVIWTTTPWTLPANLAVALHANFNYVVAECENITGDRMQFIFAESLQDSFLTECELKLLSVKAKIKGSELLNVKVQHPFLPRESVILNGDFVTADTGTGAVHIAPGHGQDDYQLGRANGLDILSPVDEKGLYTEACGLADFVGKHVFQSNEGIINLLITKQKLLARKKYTHSYPHCWRSKTPILFRAVEQFFIRIDDIRKEALDEIDRVQWLPSWGRNRIYGTVENRPDWCISRQRTWGVPLPVFYDSDGQLVMEESLIDKVASLIELHGTNAWFGQSDEWWCEQLGLKQGHRKGVDTLDVWIDSGCSHVAVLDRHPELSAPADIYIEATDQHRGWFQSSLMLSMVARGKAPYRKVITHGFVVDTSGKKISKSDQGSGKNVKPMTADHYYNKYGADMVRLWVASVDYQNEVPFSEELFQQTGESYRRIRNTLRVLLGNLYGFDVKSVVVKKSDYTMVDRWILIRLNQLIKESRLAYGAFDFRKVFTAVNQFVTNDLSALYIDITKDRMYCDAVNSGRRRAAQATMHQITTVICQLLAPILAFTADEAWESLGHQESVHLQVFPEEIKEGEDESTLIAVKELLEVRAVVQQSIEKARQEKKIGSNLEAYVKLSLPKEGYDAFLGIEEATLREFLILSGIDISRGETLAAQIEVNPHQRCERCWMHLPEVGSNADHPTLCSRCVDAVNKNENEN
jgi:isoleucyl-tRNA synthetase